MTEKDCAVVGNNFLPFQSHYKRPEYNYSKVKLDNYFTPHLDHNLKDAGYFNRVSIKSFKNYFLKHACNDVYDFLST